MPLAPKNDTSDPMLYTLNPAQMLENDYPLPSYLRDNLIEASASSSPSEGWDETLKPEDGESGKVEVIAIDCEMVSSVYSYLRLGLHVL